MVLLPEPLGPIRPKISPLRTSRLTQSTAFTPPKCLESVSSSSTERPPPPRDALPQSCVRPGHCGSACHLAQQVSPGCRIAPAAQGRRPAGIHQTTRPQVQGQHDQRAEKQVAPVAEEAQALDQEPLDEYYRRYGAEHAGEAAQYRVGDGERRHHDVEVA